jgi:hypothetical protein
MENKAATRVIKIVVVASAIALIAFVIYAFIPSTPNFMMGNAQDTFPDVHPDAGGLYSLAVFRWIG